jgi:hypothetical protein
LRIVGIHNVVRKIDEKLCEATLGSGIIAKDGGKRGITQGLWKALT